MSPGRARSMAASIAARRSAISRRSWSRRRPAASAPARDGVEDRVTVLAAGILVGHDDEPAPLAGDPAHQRPLGRVALAGRAEHRDEPAAARRRGRGEEVEHGLQRCRAVGEVDDHPERLAEVDPLHPSGHDRHRLEPGPDRGRVEPERLPERDDRQGVVDVEPPGELQVDDRPRRTGAS